MDTYPFRGNQLSGLPVSPPFAAGLAEPYLGRWPSFHPFRYEAGYQDTTSYYKFEARYCNPNLTTWTQTDPTGQNAGYTFAGDDRINETDLTGEYFAGVFESNCGGIVDQVLTAVGYGGTCVTGGLEGATRRYSRVRSCHLKTASTTTLAR